MLVIHSITHTVSENMCMKMCLTHFHMDRLTKQDNDPCLRFVTPHVKFRRKFGEWFEYSLGTVKKSALSTPLIDIQVVVIIGNFGLGNK